MCANVHATKHCDEEGYDIMSYNMVNIVHASEGEETNNSQYNEEIILEGPNKDYSQISSNITPLVVPLRPVGIEITYVTTRVIR